MFKNIKDEMKASFLKKMKVNIVYGQAIVIVSMMILQALFLYSIVYRLGEAFQSTWIVISVIAFLLSVYLVNSNKHPNEKIMWIAFLIIVPLFASALYLYTDRNRKRKKEISRIEEITRKSNDFLKPDRGLMDNIKIENPDLYNISSFFTVYSGAPLYSDTKTKYLSSGEEKFAEMLLILKEAKEFIFLEYFIIRPGYMWDEILKVLKKKAKEGVEVRIMYDGTCILYLLPFEYPKTLESFGFKVKVFSPIRPFISNTLNNRDHRKILIVDGKYAITGGANIGDEYINQMEGHGFRKETAISIKGPAVDGFTNMFLQMWEESADYSLYEKYLNKADKYNSDGFVIPFADSPLDNIPVGKYIYLNMINNASKYVYITSPYLVIDYEMENALIFAAIRGVDVRVILPSVGDAAFYIYLAHSRYEKLILSGVKIFEYNPGLIHSKIIISDTKSAIVGTINLDYRSQYHNYECGAYIYNTSEVVKIEEDLLKTINEEAKLMTIEDLKSDKPHSKLIASILKKLEPLL